MMIMNSLQLRSVDDVFTNMHYSRLANCDFSSNSISSVNGTALVQYITSRSHDIKFDLRHNNLTTVSITSYCHDIVVIIFGTKKFLIALV